LPSVVSPTSRLSSCATIDTSMSVKFGYYGWVGHNMRWWAIENNGRHWITIPQPPESSSSSEYCVNGWGCIIRKPREISTFVVINIWTIPGMNSISREEARNWDNFEIPPHLQMFNKTDDKASDPKPHEQNKEKGARYASYSMDCSCYPRKRKIRGMRPENQRYNL